MPITCKVVFRFHDDGEWEAYGVDHNAYGFGENLNEAKQDIIDALALLLEVETDQIDLEIFDERQVHPGNETCPPVWVRAYMDADSYKMLARRELRDQILSVLEKSPEYLNTFHNGQSSMGDIVATIAFSDDMFMDLLEQIGTTERLFVGMPTDRAIFWQCIFTSKAEHQSPNAINVLELGLSDASTVGDFMQATHATVDNPQDFLVPA